MPKVPNSKTDFKNQLQAKSRTRRKALAREVSVATAASTPARNDLQPTLQISSVPIASLKAAPRRVRKSESDQIERAVKSIGTYGLVMPILIDRHNQVINGHTVLEAAKSLGFEEISCVRIEHLSTNEVRALRIALNRVQELGVWDGDALRLEMIELIEQDIDLTATGFTEIEIDQIIICPEGSGENDEEEDPPENPITRFGDLFQLGDHYLLCGDSLNAVTYETLMQGKQAQAVFSDPPYNCPIAGFVGGLGKIKHKDFAFAVGEKSDEEFLDFLATYLSHAKRVTSDGAVIFACMDWRQIDILLYAGRLAGLSRINKAIWNKGSGGMGSLYRSAYEEVAVFCNGKRPAVNNVQLGRHGRDRMNVWNYPSANRRGSSAAEQLGKHPTPKPTELVRDAILDITNKGDIVLDPFMGSGTTIIAAQQCGRIAYGIEYDPGYVDVAIRRWQKQFGTDIIHVGSGKPFRTLEAERMAERDIMAQADPAQPADRRNEAQA